jgi:WD40 repeat protein
MDDLKQTTEDVFTLKQSPITCVDSMHHTGAPHTFIIECADGNLYLYSLSGRVEKLVPAQTNGVACASVNPDGLSIASGGKDGVLKMWSRNSIFGMSLANAGGAVASGN